MFNTEIDQKFEMSGQFKPENTALVLIDYPVARFSSFETRVPTSLRPVREDHIQGPLAPALQHASPDAYNARVKRVGIVNAWAESNFN